MKKQHIITIGPDSKFEVIIIEQISQGCCCHFSNHRGGSVTEAALVGSSKFHRRHHCCALTAGLALGPICSPRTGPPLPWHRPRDKGQQQDYYIIHIPSITIFTPDDHVIRLKWFQDPVSSSSLAVNLLLHCIATQMETFDKPCKATGCISNIETQAAHPKSHFSQIQRYSMQENGVSDVDS